MMTLEKLGMLKQFVPKVILFFVNVFSSIYCTSFHSYLCMSDRLARPRKIFAGMDEPDVVPHVACCTMESVCNAKLFNYFMGFIWCHHTNEYFLGSNPWHMVSCISFCVSWGWCIWFIDASKNITVLVQYSSLTSEQSDRNMDDKHMSHFVATAAFTKASHDVSCTLQLNNV